MKKILITTMLVIAAISVSAQRLRVGELGSGMMAFGSGCLLDDLMQFVYNGQNCRLLLIGDKAQLPPVGEEESPALSASMLRGYGMEVYECDLNQVLRQSEDSGILWNATMIRGKWKEESGMRNVFREFLYLRKSDRKVILSLLCVIVAALGVIFFASGNEQSNGLVAADTLSVKRDYKDSFRQKSYPERTKTVYVRTKVVYRDTAYQRGRALHREEHDSAVAHYQVKIKPGEHIMLNTADTTQLKMIPGIGSYFARKVVQYGERLGGYVSVDQLDEIEGFPLDAKEYLVVQDAHPHLLNVNQLSLNELRKHPYINYYRARAITDYRRLHGPLKSLQDLRLSKDFPPEVIERLSPYVAY